MANTRSGGNGNSLAPGTTPTAPKVDPYVPTIGTDDTQIKENLNINIEKFKENIDATIGMVHLSLKEYRDTLTEEEINSENRKVRTGREDRFFAAMDNMNANLDEIKNSISSIVTAMNKKDKEQDDALVKMSGSVNSAVSDVINNVNNSINSNNSNLTSSINTAKEEVKNELTQEIETSKEEVKTDIKESAASITDSLNLSTPIGSIIGIPKLTTELQRKLEENYILCNGAKIPDDPKYDKLKELFPLTETSFKSVNRLFYTDDSMKKSKEQLGYRIGKFLRAKFGNIGQRPFALSRKGFIDLLNDMEGLNLSPNMPLYPFFTSGNRLTNFGKAINNKTHDKRPNDIYYTYNGGSRIPFERECWGGSDPLSSPGQSSNIDYTRNQIDTATHFIINVDKPITFIFRKVFEKSGYNYKVIQILVSNNDDKTVTLADLEIIVAVDTSSNADMLLYVEIDRRGSSRRANDGVGPFDSMEEFVFVIPYEFINNGPIQNPSNKDSTINNSYEIYTMNRLYQSAATTEKNRFSAPYEMLYRDFSKVGSVGAGGALYMHMSLSCSNQSACNGPSLRDYHKSTGTLRYYPGGHPIMGAYTADRPFSLFQMIINNYRRYDNLCRPSIATTDNNNRKFSNSIYYWAFFNRFSINTKDFLKFLRLDQAYTYEQLDRFFDELVAYNDLNTTNQNSPTCYPPFRGIEEKYLRDVPKIQISNLQPYPKGSKGIIKLIEFNDLSTNDYNGNGPKLICTRTVIKTTSNVINVRHDSDATRKTARGGYNSLLLYTSLGHHDINYALPKWGYQSTSGTNSTLYLNKGIGWKDETSGGLFRIRIYKYGSRELISDRLFVDFVANKDWQDDKTGGAGYESYFEEFDIVGNDQAAFQSNKYIGDSGIPKDYVVVIDRFYNPYIDVYRSTTSDTKVVSDPWDFFDMSLFFDYCNNGNKFKRYFDTKNGKYLPNLNSGNSIVTGNGTNYFKDIYYKAGTEFDQSLKANAFIFFMKYKDYEAPDPTSSNNPSGG